MKTTLETVELYIIDLRDKAALIANNAPEERERFTGRQMILLCEKALIAIAAPSNTELSNSGPLSSDPTKKASPGVAL